MQNINIYDNHLPALQDGEYEITVTQSITTVATETFAAEPMTVYVNGPRFQLSPSEFHHIFPQDGAKGDFEGTLPSISFTRSTLLWEREPFKDNEQKAPWLFLLLVDESEVSLIEEKECKFDGKEFRYPTKDNPPKDTTLAPDDLGVIANADLQFIPTEIPIQFIDLSRFDTSIIPKTLEELKYLGYTRIKEGGEEHCVAVGNRLPKPGSSSTVYLISLENKYKLDGVLDDSKKVFPVLYKWKYYTNDDQLYSISQNLNKINADDRCKTLPDNVKNSPLIFETKAEFVGFLKPQFTTDDEVVKQMCHLCKLPGGSFHDVMSNLSNGITPLMLPEKPAGIELSGSVKLPFEKETTEKDKANAWYRGPLTTQSIALKNVFKNGKVPLFVDNTGGFVPDSANDLIFTYNDMADASYAAAYELGQLTALNDTAFSSAFFEWKHRAAATKLSYKLAQKAKNSNGQQFPLFQHLPLKSKYETAPDMPQPVMDKFNNWKLLKGLPIRYLVPDPAMVPSECIRYFKVDHNWVNAFIMGAFSIGHTPRVDFSAELNSLFSHQAISGFFLHSMAVSVWHDYELDCTTISGSVKTEKATPLRKTNLDVFTHIYLFEGQIAELNFHLHPGKLHPGFMVEKSESTTYHKGDLEVTNCIEAETKVVDIKTLKEKLSAETVAAFNGKLMEGTPAVRFSIG
ncbi:MAG TPA: hypothetical protein PKA00_19050 [Saprospiraceae bacterium]|nr:hypothetical protein [Saprospiraceae bacterium]HMQ85017.1 hypothetical protein [Saprospiraceae bacterium]